jgi:hypothetical protein
VWPPALFVLVVWMFLRARRALHSRGARWLLYPVLAVLGIAALGGGYETARESLDAKAYPPPGQLVDVGGHRLHLNCTGSGSPTVVVEPGAGATSSDLAWITPAVARDTRICVYDRAGRGWSDATDDPQDAAHIAADLHTLLDRAHVPGPYVLAGHSFGGFYVLSFAAQFPDEVAGMVLLDSTATKPGPALPAGKESASASVAPVRCCPQSPTWEWNACSVSSPTTSCPSTSKQRRGPTGQQRVNSTASSGSISSRGLPRRSKRRP